MVCENLFILFIIYFLPSVKIKLIALFFPSSNGDDIITVHNIHHLKAALSLDGPTANCTMLHDTITSLLQGRSGLSKLARGDMRKALNILQSTSMAYSTVNQDAVYTCTGQ